MSDAEIIATFMAENADEETRAWWRIATRRIARGRDVALTLDALHEVEAKLQREARNADDPEPCVRRNRYIEALSAVVGGPDPWFASAEQKIEALAAVLRPVVEGE